MSAPVVDAGSVACIARGHRLQYEPAQGCHVLLYPEGMVTLNAPATEILSRCDGQRTVGEICSLISAEFDGAEVTDDVIDFLKLAASHGWVQLA